MATSNIKRRRRRTELVQEDGKATGLHAQKDPAQIRGGAGSRPPGGLPMLRTSERTTFTQCRWKWWWAYEETLKAKTDVPPLRFGTLVHMALADYYKKGVRRGPHPAESFIRYYDEEAKSQGQFGFRVEDLEQDEVWAEARDLGYAMLDHYVKHWGRDDEWEVLVTEQPFQQVVYHPLSYDPNHPPQAQKTAKPWFIYVGTLDLIIRNRRTGMIHIVDHKTAKAINVAYLSLDRQATGYWTFGLDWIYEKGLLKPDQKPGGMIYNHLRKAFPDVRPKDEDGFSLNKDGSVSKKQPSPYFSRTPIFRDFNERWRAREQVMAEFVDMERVREEGRQEDGSPPVQAYKAQGQFTCPGCFMFDTCELHEIGGDYRMMSDYALASWEPYSAHEIYTAETK